MCWESASLPGYSLGNGRNLGDRSILFWWRRLWGKKCIAERAAARHFFTNSVEGVLTLQAETLRAALLNGRHQLHPQAQLPVTFVSCVTATSTQNDIAAGHHHVCRDITHCIRLFRKRADLWRREKNNITRTVLCSLAFGEPVWCHSPMGVLCLSVCFSWLISGGVAPTTGPIKSPSLGRVKWNEMSVAETHE